ncbi:hypothetical protein [Lentibacillus jeotgali]|uniref:hypothetical protein n=1 Tax=Lentibacillus jeotgali TaxID=558169 RepID=UPI0002629324|nr:hypothetical protein [Lentibacillus jeotgali]
MKQTRRLKLLGFYDLILAAGSIWIGVMMINSSAGIFVEYPELWASGLPFNSWVTPGALAIVTFGLGNILAAFFTMKKGHSSWAVSAIMGGFFCVSLICQVIILGEIYLATIEFLVLSIIQLCLSGYVLLGYKKNLNVTKAWG